MAHGNAIAGRTVARPDSKRPRVSDERGITGLETAIVLIAFVVVASVFAFAVLSTGLLSSQTAKEAVTGGLQERRQRSWVSKGPSWPVQRARRLPSKGC